MINKINTILIGLIICSYASTQFAQSGHKNLLEGDKFYTSGEFYLAEEQYRKAREGNKDLKSTFNLGNSVYQQERFEEAVDHYTSATQLAPDNNKRSDAYYNLGNALFQNQKLEESIDAYKESIQLNPNNDQARYNLLVAKNILKQAQNQDQQQQSQDQNQEQQENQDQQDQQEQQQQENQDQQEKNEQNQDEQNQNDQEEKQDSSQQEQDIGESSFDTTRLDKQTLDSLDALKLLQIIENEEKKVQEKLKKFNGNRKKPDKDW